MAAGAQAELATATPAAGLLFRRQVRSPAVVLDQHPPLALSRPACSECQVHTHTVEEGGVSQWTKCTLGGPSTCLPVMTCVWACRRNNTECPSIQPAPPWHCAHTHSQAAGLHECVRGCGAAITAICPPAFSVPITPATTLLHLLHLPSPPRARFPLVHITLTCSASAARGLQGGRWTQREPHAHTAPLQRAQLLQ